MKTIQLIVAADEPALFFSSVKGAEGYLEAIDVNNGVYTAAYGSNGEPYSINASRNSVVIVPNTTEAPKPDELKALLLKVGKASKVEFSSNEPLSALLKKCERYLIR